jgi:hypothetical protein
MPHGQQRVIQQRRRQRWRHTREAERRRAAMGGYFWIPCHLCGVCFGGHEWRWGHTIPVGETSDQAICPPCAHDLGEAMEPVCRDYGHDIIERELLVSGIRVARCAYCLLEFDPSTREAIGRPLEVDQPPHRFEAWVA